MKNYIIILTRKSKDVARIGFVNEDEARTLFDALELEYKCEAHLIYYARETIHTIGSRFGAPYE